jgi:hypothetical protein
MASESPKCLIIKRAFAPTKNKDGRMMKGTSKSDVSSIMSQFGSIKKIDQITKKDYKSNQKFFMFFIHYNSFTIDEDTMEALNSGNTIEVDYSPQGKYWVVEKFVPREGGAKTVRPMGVRIRPKKKVEAPADEPM